MYVWRCFFVEYNSQNKSTKCYKTVRIVKIKCMLFPKPKKKKSSNSWVCNRQKVVQMVPLFAPVPVSLNWNKCILLIN